MKKYGDAEKADVLPDEKVEVLKEHIAKTGKSLNDFTDEEKDELYDDLEEV